VYAQKIKYKKKITVATIRESKILIVSYICLAITHRFLLLQSFFSVKL